MLFIHNKNEYLRTYLTVNKTWIHDNTPENKQQLKQCVSLDESSLKNAEVGVSFTKVKATVFCNARDIIQAAYLLKERIFDEIYETQMKNCV